MKKKKIESLVFQVLLFVFLLTGMHVSVHAAEKINFTNMVSRYGDEVYYVLDYSKGMNAGNIKKYNIKTHSKSTVARGKYDQVLADKNYLYATEDKNPDCGDMASYSIFRINKKTGSRKFLDHGFAPTKVGNYIYYIKLKKSQDKYYYGLYQEPIGIYRMTASGKNKKCIYKYPRGGNLLLGASKNKLYAEVYDSNYKYNYTIYCINFNGKVLSKSVDMTNKISNICGRSEYYGRMTCNGWKITDANGKLYALKNGKKKLILTSGVWSWFPGVYQVGDKIIAGTIKKGNNFQSACYGYYYIMNPDGSDKRFLCKHMMAG